MVDGIVFELTEKILEGIVLLFDTRDPRKMRFDFTDLNVTDSRIVITP
jgi:hypothetical protein